MIQLEYSKKNRAASFNVITKYANEYFKMIKGDGKDIDPLSYSNVTLPFKELSEDLSIKLEATLASSPIESEKAYKELGGEIGLFWRLAQVPKTLVFFLEQSYRSYLLNQGFRLSLREVTGGNYSLEVAKARSPIGCANLIEDEEEQQDSKTNYSLSNFHLPEDTFNSKAAIIFGAADFTIKHPGTAVFLRTQEEKTASFVKALCCAKMLDNGFFDLGLSRLSPDDRFKNNFLLVE